MTDESQNCNSPQHKNNRTLYFANATYLTEAFIRAVVSGYNGSSKDSRSSPLVIHKINMQGHADEWIMLTMSEHYMAKKLWKLLEKRTVAEIAAKYNLKVPTPAPSEEKTPAVQDEPLTISWAMNREQRATHNRLATPETTLPKKKTGKPAILAEPANVCSMDPPSSPPLPPPEAVQVATPTAPVDPPFPMKWADEPGELSELPDTSSQKPQVFAYLPPMIKQHQQPLQRPMVWYQSQPQSQLQQYQITTASLERGVIGTFYVPDDKYKAICAILFT